MDYLPFEKAIELLDKSAAQRLRDGGVDIRTFMTLRAKSVMAQIRDHGQAGACME